MKTGLRDRISGEREAAENGKVTRSRRLARTGLFESFVHLLLTDICTTIGENTLNVGMCIIKAEQQQAALFWKPVVPFTSGLT